MFDNIENKIKILAYVVAIMGILVSIIYGIVLIVANEIGLGLLVAIIGSVLSWASCFILYGFGEIIVLLMSISFHTKKNMQNSEVIKSRDNKNNNRIESFTNIYANNICQWCKKRGVKIRKIQVEDDVMKVCDECYDRYFNTDLKSVDINEDISEQETTDLQFMPIIPTSKAHHYLCNSCQNNIATFFANNGKVNIYVCDDCYKKYMSKTFNEDI